MMLAICRPMLLAATKAPYVATLAFLKEALGVKGVATKKDQVFSLDPVQPIPMPTIARSLTKCTKRAEALRFLADLLEGQLADQSNLIKESRIRHARDNVAETLRHILMEPSDPFMKLLTSSSTPRLHRHHYKDEENIHAKTKLAKLVGIDLSPKIYLARMLGLVKEIETIFEIQLGGTFALDLIAHEQNTITFGELVQEVEEQIKASPLPLK